MNSTFPLGQESSRSRQPILSNPNPSVHPTDGRAHKANQSLLAVPDLIAQRAALAPQALAVQSGAECLTYQSLNQRANQLAHYLRALGVGAGTVVGLCLERSLDLVIASLAVLKARGVYMPLDVKTPRERLALVLEDAQAPVLVTHSSLAESLAAGRMLVALDTEAAGIARLSQAPLADAATLE